METNIWILIVTGCSVLVALLTYRLTSKMRKDTLPYVNVEWKTPASFNVKVNNTRLDLYFLIEGLFTNSGGQTVSAIELISQDTGFVYTLNLRKGQPVVQKSYTNLPEFYLLSQSLSDFINANLDNPKQITFDSNKKIELNPKTKEISLNIPIEPGNTHRITMCFVFRDWMNLELKETNDVLIAFLVRFNNKQTTALNVAVGGGGPLTKFKRDNRQKLFGTT